MTTRRKKRETRSECRCEKCASLCQRRPGIFAPGEATKAAASLGMTLQAFFRKYLCVDFWSAEDREVYHLSPAWTPLPGPTNWRSILAGFDAARFEVQSLVGRRIGFADGFTHGPCALLTPNGCRLSFENRPRECREAYGCGKMTNEEGIGLHKRVSELWFDAKTQAEIDAAYQEGR